MNQTISPEELLIRVENIEKSLRKKAKREELTLKEKFAIHDQAQSLMRWFEEMENQLNLAIPEAYKNLKEIIKTFSNLVDNALGIIP